LKAITTVVGLVILTLASSIPALADLTISTTNGRSVLVTMTYYISGDTLRQDWSIGNRHIYDFEKNNVTTLDTHNGLYRIDSIGANGVLELFNDPDLISSTQIVDTKKTTIALGHVCEHYIVTYTTNMNMFTAAVRKHMDKSPVTRFDVLAATDLAGDEAKCFTRLQLGPKAASAIIGLPVVITKSSSSIQVTSVSTDKLPSGILDIPQSYKKSDKVDSPGLVGG
jgi:hypothetical protein